MHDVTDPDVAEGQPVTEMYWPETYKEVIRNEVKRAVVPKLARSRDLRKVYAKRFADDYDSLESFADRIGDMVVIGAENGADDAFDNIYTAFVADSLPPKAMGYARYYWPGSLPQPTQKDIHRVVAADYSQERSYRSQYEHHYVSSYRDFDEFINAVADSVVTGAVNGADDMLGQIYRSFLTLLPLPPARRHSRRVKGW